MFSATVAQLVEQLICNQPVVGSTPIDGSTLNAGVRSYRQGHPVVTRKVAGSNPAAPAILYHIRKDNDDSHRSETLRVRARKH